MDSTRRKPRTAGDREITAAAPMDKPRVSAMARLITISGNVIVARWPTWEVTARPVSADTPRSPCSSPPAQSRYCTTYGRSRPNSARRAATRAGDAFMPAITTATSPGRMRSIANTSTEMPNSAAANSSKRCIKNRITPPLSIPSPPPVASPAGWAVHGRARHGITPAPRPTDGFRDYLV